MRVATAWQALEQRPMRFLASSWPWRALLYLASGAVLGVLAIGLAAVVVTGVAVPLRVAVAVGLLALFAACGIPVARLERRRLRLVDLDRLPDPRRPAAGGGLRRRITARLREPATWREVALSLLVASALCWLDLAVLGLAFVLPVSLFLAPVDDPSSWAWVVVGVLLLAAAPWTITSWAGARAALTRTLLGPRDAELGAELTEVRRSRARLVTAFDAERARIERDLHDGTQQRLVSLGMSLGLARLDAPDGSPLAHRLDDARAQLDTALAELRDLVRGLNPQVLADNGLVAAVQDTAARSPVPVAVDLDLPRRLPAHVESAAYFVITEAMANIAKHSRACSAAVHGRHRSDVLVLEITDDGIGGAAAERGTGIAGLAERLSSIDGRLRLSSPIGGPTLLRMEIPCRFA